MTNRCIPIFSLSKIIQDFDSLDGGDSEVAVASHMDGAKKKARRSHKGNISKAQRYLTPDVVEINGRRLPIEIAEYALANDLTEEQLDEYADSVVEQEKMDEIEFTRRVELMREKYEYRNVNSGKASRSEQLGKKKTGSNKTAALDVFIDQEKQDDRRSLSLPIRPPRIFYLNFQQGSLVLRNSFSRQKQKLESKSLSPRSIFQSMWSNRSNGHTLDDKNLDALSTEPEDNINRHLKSTSVQEKRPLSTSDIELLRCIGLDTYVMIRFLRFCFDVTFYPFLMSLLVLIPTYYVDQYDGIEEDDDLFVEIQTGGYFRFTMNRLPPSSDKIWVSFGFSVIFILFILRRLWVEWETFVALRFDFMANGDAKNDRDADKIGGGSSFKSRSVVSMEESLVDKNIQQFRNSCLVEYIPESHRRDAELYQFFDSVFPGQVVRAEVLLNAKRMMELVKERQTVIEKYEVIYAKHQHAKQKFYRIKDGIEVDECSMLYCISCGCFRNKDKPPEEPTLRSGKGACSCCKGNRVKALPYLLSEIKRLNREIKKEHKKISIEKEMAEDKDEAQDFISSNLKGAKAFFRGTTKDLNCSTGFVEFKTLSAKQSALQSNLTGTNGYMVTTSAPDPRDMIWDNATVELNFIQIKTLQCEALLFTGTLFWTVIVGGITLVTDIDRIQPYLPSWLNTEEDTFWYLIIQGYLPVIFLELLMLVVPFLLRIIATKFIRFKTHSEVDKFIFKWHFAYRIANLIIIIVKHQVLTTAQNILSNPRLAFDTLATGIATSSQFFLNNMIVQAGTETLWELAQIPRILSYFILHQIITIEATPKRKLERLREPGAIEWGDTVPRFIFGLLVAVVYSAIVPLVTGVCAVFFYIATKVYTHQALFIYAQPYEGGGQLMYQLNTAIMVILHVYVTIFSILLGLKKTSFTGGAFFFIMNIIIFLVRHRLYATFIAPGLNLAMTNARIIDEQTKIVEERSRLFHAYKATKKSKKSHPFTPPNTKQTRFKLDMDIESRQRSEMLDEEADKTPETSDVYLYRQPFLNKAELETGPRPYHS
jgi:hypothetical protein